MKPIKKFYHISAKYRSVTLICLVLIISFSLAFFPVYQLNQLISLELPPDNPGIYTHEFFESDTIKARYPKVSEFIATFQSLLKFTTSNNPVESLKPEEHAETEAIIQRMSQYSFSPMQKYLLQNPRMLHFHRLRDIREITEYLIHYLNFKKNQEDNYSSIPIVRSISNALLFMELNDRILIQKIISLSIQGQLVKSLHNLYKEQKITPEEAASLANCLNKLLDDSMSIEDTMRAEFELCKDAILQYYRKIPISLWLINLVYGDPISQYQELVDNNFKDDPKEFKAKHPHMLLQIAIPEFLRAQYKMAQDIAKYHILFKELSTLNPEIKLPEKDKEQIVLVHVPNSNPIEFTAKLYFKGKTPHVVDIELNETN
jgi:hypothetical protein